MTTLRHLRPLVLSGLILLVGSSRAAAYPLLQLDIGGGVYNTETETVTATGLSFTLYAYLTPPPNTSTQALATLLNTTYYLSAALAPKVSVSGGNFGSFSFNQQTVRATQDMVYGNPPLETYLGGAARDSGDLAKHDIYDTYFKEFSFKFTPTQRTAAYNTQDDTGQGPTPSPTGNMYFMAFTVDTSLLDPRYTVHFDMYDEVLKKGGDIDIGNFAPFSKDAESFAVPEPGSLFLLGSGIAALVARQRRRRHSSTPH
jgi:hypothetical protein